MEAIRIGSKYLKGYFNPRTLATFDAYHPIAPKCKPSVKCFQTLFMYILIKIDKVDELSSSEQSAFEDMRRNGIRPGFHFMFITNTKVAVWKVLETGKSDSTISMFSSSYC